MVKKITYKGKEIDIKDLKVFWTDSFGRDEEGDIDDFGYSKYNEGYAECDAGEGW